MPIGHIRCRSPRHPAARTAPRRYTAGTSRQMSGKQFPSSAHIRPRIALGADVAGMRSDRQIGRLRTQDVGMTGDVDAVSRRSTGRVRSSGTASGVLSARYAKRPMRGVSRIWRRERDVIAIAQPQRLPATSRVLKCVPMVGRAPRGSQVVVGAQKKGAAERQRPKDQLNRVSWPGCERQC